VETKNIAGMSMKGGRKDNFYFCLLEYYPESSRWFLKSLLQVKDEEGRDGDDAVREWIEDFNLRRLVVDFPLSSPACHSCKLDCPGVEACPKAEVSPVRERIHRLLQEDVEIHEQHPKTYERKRNVDDEIDVSRDILDKEPHEHILSRAFKRRLKKGFLPYWNRAVDFWIWRHYYDQLLDIFNASYDSFGNTSLMLISRFSYLRRHFPQGLELFESNAPVILIELLRSKIIMRKDIDQLSDIELCVEARLDIIKKIEKHLSIFIYDRDLEILVRQPRAFESFLMALAGQNIQEGKSRNIPSWTQPEETKFIAPNF
tara:strand:- start:1199 stop:2143 length:945 start_codon:yes stop_codon:yes gene_type:complete